MNGHIVVAQANIAAPSQEPRVVSISKPQGNQAVDVELGYGKSVKLDLSGIANEKVTFVHAGEKLIILFDNHSTVTVHPFYDANGVPLQNLLVEVAPGRDLSGSQFTSAFPITTDQSVVPAAGEHVVHVVKPSDGQAVTVELGYRDAAKLDLSGVANDKMTLVHVGENLIILFDNSSTVTVHPFFDSTGAPLQSMSVEVSPGRDLPSSEFASVFPITNDQSVLPAAGDNGVAPLASGANFSSASVDALTLPNPLPLLPARDAAEFRDDERNHPPAAAAGTTIDNSNSSESQSGAAGLRRRPAKGRKFRRHPRCHRYQCVAGCGYRGLFQGVHLHQRRCHHLFAGPALGHRQRRGFGAVPRRPVDLAVQHWRRDHRLDVGNGGRRDPGNTAFTLNVEARAAR